MSDLQEVEPLGGGEEEPCQGKGGPSEGPGHSSSPRGGDRVAKLPPHQGLVRITGTFQKQGLP